MRTLKVPKHAWDTVKYLCPIGHDDPDRKHFHWWANKGMFQHIAMIDEAAITLTFVVKTHKSMFPDYDGPKKKYYHLISIHITALGSGPDPKYHLGKTPKKIGHAVKRLMREAHMVR